jgi:hypothetical protein
MAIGEKLFEDSGKTTGVTIKPGPDGITLEFNFAGELGGLGRMQGAKGKFFGTGVLVQRPTGPMNGSYTVLMTTQDGESILLAGQSLSATIGGRLRDASLVRFSTSSQKYAWLNNVICLREAESSADFQSFSGTLYEWK